MSKGELPDDWAYALERRGIRSIRGVADAANVSPMAASRLVKGEATSAKTVRHVADALFGGDRNKVWQLHGSALRDHGDWQLPEEASLLTDEQRTAVVSVVRAMLPPEVRGGGAGGKRAAATSEPGQRPDNVKEMPRPAVRQAKAARTGKPSQREKAREHDKAAEAVEEDRTGMEPI